MDDRDIDVRSFASADKPGEVLRVYAELGVGSSLIVVDTDDLDAVRTEFDINHPGGYRWEQLNAGPGQCRVRIHKNASTPLPRVLCDTDNLDVEADRSGAVWRLPMRQRDLDSNIIQLPAGATIDAHAGPDLDVLIHVLHGSGTLHTELDPVALSPGALVWLPRRSRRQFTAGPDGLRYLTVHQRRTARALDTITTRDSS